jgi:hypothetical protein
MTVYMHWTKTNVLFLNKHTLSLFLLVVKNILQ